MSRLKGLDLCWRRAVLGLLGVLCLYNPVAATPGVLHLLTSAADTQGAVCLDGSPGAYYLRRGSGSGTDKWYVHFQGGGWCTSNEECRDRANGFLGSTTPQYNPEVLDLQKVTYCFYHALSTNATTNPLMYNWNAVVVRYCDGTSFTGNNPDPIIVGSQKIFFRGHRILNALAEDLLKEGMENATNVIIGGGSAGGLATLLHMDWWRTKMKDSVRLTGMPLDGFFLDYNITKLPVLHSAKMQWLFNTAQCRVSDLCLARVHASGLEPWRCLFPEYAVATNKRPAVYFVQSIYDSWQLDNILGTRDTGNVNTYGKELLGRLHGVQQEFDGGYVTSCCQHTAEYDTLSMGGRSYLTAHADWYGHLTKPGDWLIQQQVYPCSWCCGYNGISGISVSSNTNSFWGDVISKFWQIGNVSG